MCELCKENNNSKKDALDDPHDSWNFIVTRKETYNSPKVYDTKKHSAAQREIILFALCVAGGLAWSVIIVIAILIYSSAITY